MHERVRREFWGYARDERLHREQLIAEAYQGIRPAPGYPAQPDHTEKATLFDLLDGEAATGIRLTESYAMWPGASVCGVYFAHPDSHYFGVGKIERDQAADYARRKGWSIEDAERWLAPVLNYDPKLARSAATDGDRRSCATRAMSLGRYLDGRDLGRLGGRTPHRLPRLPARGAAQLPGAL